MYALYLVKSFERYCLVSQHGNLFKQKFTQTHARKNEMLGSALVTFPGFTLTRKLVDANSLHTVVAEETATILHHWLIALQIVEDHQSKKELGLDLYKVCR